MRLGHIALLGLAATLLCGAPALVGAAAIGDVVYCEQFEGGTPFTFTTDHVYSAPPSLTDTSASPLWQTLTYTVDVNPRLWHMYWASYGDHTTGTGNMMIVNAANDGAGCDVTVFESPVITVHPDTDYTISYWVALSIQTAPPVLRATVNDVVIGTFDADVPAELNANGTWYQVTYTWNSGDATTAQIRLCDTDTVYSGDDYALDDICMSYASIPLCWQGETAWSDGTRYLARGNWATYTQYAAGATVTLYAGRDMPAGTVTFSAVVDGHVTITIELNDGFRFLDFDPNVKIKGYGAAPSGEDPIPGLFPDRGYATGASYSIVVDSANYYGVHVNVEWSYECE